MMSPDGSEEMVKHTREADEAPPRDGRAARALRTRQAVADALLRLLEEGELRPTSRMIAEKAGVSERTIFQHFEDRYRYAASVGKQQTHQGSISSCSSGSSSPSISICV